MDCRVLKKGKCEITNGYSTEHKAVDVVGENYTIDAVVAHSDGKIIYIQDGYKNAKGSFGMSSYGNCIKIEHKNGYSTLYAHLAKGILALNNSEVKRGQIIGYMSDSGNAYGSHLHFEVYKNGQKIDPTSYLNEDLCSSENKRNLFYTVKEGDTLIDIASKYNTTYQEIAKYNNIANPNLIYPNQKLKIPYNSSENDDIMYLVKKGDTLSSIAEKYNVSWQQIYNDNKNIIGNNPNLIYPEQKLIIKK